MPDVYAVILARRNVPLLGLFHALSSLIGINLSSAISRRIIFGTKKKINERLRLLQRFLNLLPRFFKNRHSNSARRWPYFSETTQYFSSFQDARSSRSSVYYVVKYLSKILCDLAECLLLLDSAS